MEEWAIGLVAVVAVIAAIVLAVMYVAVFLYVVAAVVFSVILGLADAVTSARFLPGCPWVMWAAWGAVTGLFVGLWAEAKNLGVMGWRPLLVSAPIIAMVGVAMVASKWAPLPERPPTYRPHARTAALGVWTGTMTAARGASYGYSLRLERDPSGPAGAVLAKLWQRDKKTGTNATELMRGTADAATGRVRLEGYEFGPTWPRGWKLDQVEAQLAADGTLTGTYRSKGSTSSAPPGRIVGQRQSGEPGSG